MDRFAEDLHGAVAYARERVGTSPKSGAPTVPADPAFHGEGAGGDVGWLDATQSLPPVV